MTATTATEGSSDFLTRLKEANPSITAEEASAVRSGLVAIAREILEQEETALDRSLKDWWQWLENEGYDRARLSTHLVDECTAQIGHQERDALLAFCLEIQSESEGLTRLAAHLDRQHPELLKAFEELEDQATQEEQQLLAVSGGMSKGAGWGLGVGLVIGTGAIVFIGYKINQARQLRKQVKQSLDRAEQALNNNKREAVEIAQSEINVAENNLNPLQALGHQLERSASHLTREQARLIGSEVAGSQPSNAHPLQLLARYENHEIEHLANQMAWNYLKLNPAGLKQKLDNVTLSKKGIAGIEDALREHPGYEKHLREFERGMADKYNEPWDEFQQRAIAEFEKGKGTWYTLNLEHQLKEAKVATENHMIKLWQSNTAKAFKKTIKNQIAYEERKAAGRLDARLEKDLDKAGKDFLAANINVKHDLAKLEDEVTQTIKTAEAMAERDAEDLVIEIKDAGGEIPRP